MSTTTVPSYHLVNAGITSDSATATIDMSKHPSKDYCFTVKRTAGATNTISVAFSGSLDNSTWVTLATITDVTSGFNSAIVSDKPYLYVRYFVTTVGAANTLTIEILAI